MMEMRTRDTFVEPDGTDNGSLASEGGVVAIRTDTRAHLQIRSSVTNKLRSPRLGGFAARREYVNPVLHGLRIGPAPHFPAIPIAATPVGMKPNLRSRPPAMVCDPHRHIPRWYESDVPRVDGVFDLHPHEAGT